MRELVPLFHECQEMGQGKDLPSGKLIFEMSVIGDESLGGLVEDVKFTDDSELKSNSEFAECMRETLFSLKLSAPKGRGRLLIKYPMAFSAPNAPRPAPRNTEYPRIHVQEAINPGARFRGPPHELILESRLGADWGAGALLAKAHPPIGDE